MQLNQGPKIEKIFNNQEDTHRVHGNDEQEIEPQLERLQTINEAMLERAVKEKMNMLDEEQESESFSEGMEVHRDKSDKVSLPALSR